MVRILLSIFLLINSLPTLQAQTGGEGIFNFLQLTNSAKSAALGGVQVALSGSEPELVLSNPALLSATMSNSLTVNYSRYLAGIGFGTGTYAKDLGKYGMAAMGIQFVNYGQFVAADENGLITGSFSAADYALVLTYSKQFGRVFTIGASFKPIYSHLENYRSFGMAADLGIVHQSANGLTKIAFCIKDLGAQLKPYYDGGSHEKVISSFQLGVSHRLQHAPISYFITAYDLNRWNSEVTATDPNDLPTDLPGTSALTKTMRHFSLGAELFPENKLTVRIGYNYRKAVDLAVADISTFSGFSAGLGVNWSAIRLNYALSGYAHAGLVHNFSLTTNFDRIRRK